MPRLPLVPVCALVLGLGFGPGFGMGRAAATEAVEGVVGSALGSTPESKPEPAAETASETTSGHTPGGAAALLPARPSVREQNCLSPADMREVVAEGGVVEPVAAIRAARQALPKAEIVRANLCRQEARQEPRQEDRHEGRREGAPDRREEGLVYLITALRRDGHFVHVTIDARSGSVAERW